jgi:GxxExxY protein
VFDIKYKNKCDELSNKIIGAAIEVHKTLGPGLLESTYEACLCYELSSKEMGFKRQLALPVNYKGKNLDAGYRIDVLVEDLVILELKSIDAFLPIHTSQLITYLKLSDKWLGLLINFNVKYLDKGIKRVVNG